uniref:Zinc finger, CCHC-type n=1 Tax=Tanacetum cinerariifolium TaxID=118510 RepID=A0A6L2N0J5_TANCI|nr:zinc finger, CCHC-type [Tanacetum cinerariifolium]
MDTAEPFNVPVNPVTLRILHDVGLSGSWISLNATRGSKEIAGLMLMTMEPEIQQNLEPLHAHEMLKELKTLFAQQAEHELLHTTRDFHSCRQEEGQSVSLYVLKMKGYIDNIEHLGHPVTLGLGIVNELHAMLKLHEQTLPKSNAPALHAIRAGKVQKGYWKRNCPQYLAELMKKKKNEFLELVVQNSLIDQEASGSLEDLEIIQEEDTYPSLDTSLNHEEDDLEIDEPQRDLGEPANYKAAFLDLESEKCLNAMNVEMQSMKVNEVWDLVELPPNGKTVGSKWLFKKKTDMDGNIHIYKARLVVKGYTQTSGIDYEETFSPVADIRAIRILITIAAYYDYQICIPMLQSVKTYLGKCFAMKDLGSIMYAVRCTRPDVAFAQNSAKQSIFATSSTEAAYIIAFDASKEAVWVRKFISGLGVVPIIEEPISMYFDNTRAIAIANESGITKGARHFRAKVHYLREVIEFGDIKLEKVHTDDNLADPFTKALAFPKHSEYTRNIGMLPARLFGVIRTPMDFGTICNNLENGLMYKNSKNVYKDVEYLWGNCYKYNSKGDYIQELIRRVKRVGLGNEMDHIQDEDHQPRTISNGPPLSTFFSHLLEILTKIKSFHQKGGPLFGYGFQECGLKAFWMMPVWDPLRSSSYSDCTGVVGCSLTGHIDVTLFSDGM